MEREDIKKKMLDAERNLMIADHLMYSTYPLVKDPKLLLTIAEDIYKSLFLSVNALLEYDEMYKRVRMLPQDFRSRLDIFKSCAPLHGIDTAIIKVIEDLRSFFERYKKSGTAFARQGSYIVFSEDFRITRLDFSKLKDYLSQSKVFLTNANNVFRYDVRFGTRGR